MWGVYYSKCRRPPPLGPLQSEYMTVAQAAREIPRRFPGIIMNAETLRRGVVGVAPKPVGRRPFIPVRGEMYIADLVRAMRKLKFAVFREDIMNMANAMIEGTDVALCFEGGIVTAKWQGLQILLAPSPNPPPSSYKYTRTLILLRRGTYTEALHATFRGRRRRPPTSHYPRMGHKEASRRSARRSIHVGGRGWFLGITPESGAAGRSVGVQFFKGVFLCVDFGVGVLCCFCSVSAVT